MTIDWSATGDMLSGLGAIGGSLAVFWATYKAANTVENWKRQKVEERKFDHAERTLAAVHHAREALNYVRIPLIQAHELLTAREALEREDGWAHLLQERQDRLITAQALIERMKRTADAADALAGCIPLARALFNDELAQALTDLHRQFWSVRTWIDAYAEDRGGDADFSIKIRRELFSANDAQSEVVQFLNSSIAAVDNVCLPILRAR